MLYGRGCDFVSLCCLRPSAFRRPLASNRGRSFATGSPLRLVSSLALVILAACSSGHEPVSRCDALTAAKFKTADVTGTVMWGGDASGTWTFDAHPVRSIPAQRQSTFATGVLPVHDKAFITSGWRMCLVDAGGRRVWSQRREGGFSVPALQGDLLVAPNSSRQDTHLFAFDARTGNQRWSWTQPRSPEVRTGRIGPPLLSGDRVYVTGSEGLFSVDAQNGRTLWRDAEGALATVVVRDGIVYVSNGKVLRFLDANSGTERARVDVRDRSVIAGPGLVYAANQTGVAGYDSVSGRPRWQTRVQVFSDKPAMALVGDLLAIVGFEGTSQHDLSHQSIFGLDASTGKERWHYTADEEGIKSSLSAAQDVLYAGNDDGLLVAIDAVSGRQLWKTRVEIETHLDPDSLSSGPRTRTLEGDVALVMPGDEAVYTLGQSWRISDTTSDGALFLYDSSG